MKKNSWRLSWMRLLLWSHVVGIVGFYLVLWWRTAPNQADRVKRALPQERQAASKDPLVSMIVPARNEERNIRRCVSSLLEQDYTNYEVIAVDDASTDQTGRILDELASTHPQGERLWTLRLRDLPEGWAGKPHALYRGTQEAHGEWLLFTDADTWHEPEALRSALQMAQEECIDLLTLAATQELPTFWDKVLMPMAMLGISMQYPPRQVNDPTSPVAIASGPYILIRRAVYEHLGGYARPDLRNTLLDDLDLARVVKADGFRLRFVDGAGLVHVHMYQGFSEIWRGWRKNAFLGSRGGVAYSLLQLIGLPMVTIVPFLLPLLAQLTRKWQGGVSAAEARLATTIALTPLLVYRVWLNRMMQVPWYYAATHPLAGAVFEGILGQSMWRVLTRKGVDWRGRAYYNHQEMKAEASTFAPDR